MSPSSPIGWNPAGTYTGDPRGFTQFARQVMADLAASIERRVRFENEVHNKSLGESVRLWEEIYGPGAGGRLTPPATPEG